MRAIQVRHGAVIAFAEALPIILTFIPRHMGVTVFFTIFNVRRAVIIKVLAGALNSIMKALTLRFAKFRRSLVPVPVFLSSTGRRRSRRHCTCFRSGWSDQRQRKSKN